MENLYTKIWEDEQIIPNFSVTDWGKIHPYINTDAKLRNQLIESNGQCLIIYSQTLNSPIAFILFLDDGEIHGKPKISIHGGVWVESVFLRVKSLILVCDILFSRGAEIRTSCTIDNLNCHKLLTGLGFVNHYTSEGCRYYWLPYKRYINSVFYKRFHS